VPEPDGGGLGESAELKRNALIAQLVVIQSRARSPGRAPCFLGAAALNLCGDLARKVAADNCGAPGRLLLFERPRYILALLGDGVGF